MEAIIRHSGKQFKVREGGTIQVDYGEAQPGSSVEFTEVLYIGEEVGNRNEAFEDLLWSLVNSTEFLHRR